MEGVGRTPSCARASPSMAAAATGVGLAAGGRQQVPLRTWVCGGQAGAASTSSGMRPAAAAAALSPSMAQGAGALAGRGSRLPAAALVAALGVAALRPPRPKQPRRGRICGRFASAAPEAGGDVPFEVAATADRGMAAFAARPLAAGEPVLDEAPLMRLRFQGDPTEDVLGVARAFGELSPAAREALLGLCGLPPELASFGLMTALSLCPPKEAELPPGVTAAELRQLVGIVDCNVQRVVDIDTVARNWEAEVSCGLYERCSRFNHSCAPNLSRRFTADGRVQLRTSRAVAAGEELTISYLGDAELLQSTERRRFQLQPYGFTCDCPRCAAPEDPARAFRCPSCGPGEVFAGAGGADLAGRRCGSCGEAVCAGDAARALAGEESALVALETAKYCLPQPADPAASAANLEASLAGAEERLATRHWALGALHHYAQELHRLAGDPARRARRLESKLRFLEAAHPEPLPLGLREWDRAACEELLGTLRV